MSSRLERWKELKRKYGSLYTNLDLVLAEDDPMGLISGGAPDNEYEVEVDRILERIEEADSPQQMGQLMYDVFVQCFKPAFAQPNVPPTERRRAEFAALGEQAWTMWQTWKKEA